VSDTSCPVWAVVLAAGASTRFGSPKQRLLLPGVLERVRASVVDDVVVVLGAQKVETDARTVHCREWERGIGASLRCGLAALPEEAEAAVVVLADGPRLAPEAVDRVIEVWRESGAEVVAATYGGVRLHPVLLARDVWDRVPDAGARELPAQLIPCDDLGAPGDVDTPADRVRSVIERLVTDGTAFPVSVSRAEGEALRRWVTGERAAHTVEVGLGYGLSALFICEGLLLNSRAEPRHVVIDPYQQTRFAGAGLRVLEDAGASHLVEHYAEESQLVLPRFVSEGRSFDLGFVDGNHRFDALFLDLVYLERLVQPGGIVFLDDYQLPAVSRAVSFFVTNLDWSVEEESDADDDHHWAVLRTSDQPDTRSFEDYVDF
jgi:CTP:molybdopterin cytidylyltransferase MocA/predicted O-methyltransferase YrrM